MRKETAAGGGARDYTAGSQEDLTGAETAESELVQVGRAAAQTGIRPVRTIVHVRGRPRRSATANE